MGEFGELAAEAVSKLELDVEVYGGEALERKEVDRRVGEEYINSLVT